MTFWHYIIIGIIIQLIVYVERFARLQEVRQAYKENWADPRFWLGLLCTSVVNVIAWPVAIYFEIRLIQCGT